MDFSHYTDEPVRLAVELVNTDERGPGVEHLANATQLAAFFDGYRHLWEGVPAPRADDLPAIHALRDRLRRVFEAPDAATAADILNALLSESTATPRLSIHSGDPHLHFESLDSTFPQWLGVVTAMALATVIVEHGVDRFGVCAAGDCQDVYVDTTRNRSRRHCSSTCSTREHVAAYRQRQRHTD